MPLEQGILYIPVPSSHQDDWLGQRGVSVQLHGWGWVLSQGSLYLQPQASAPQTWRMLHSKVMADQLQTPRSSATRRSLLSFLAQRKLSPCPASVQVGIGRSSHTWRCDLLFASMFRKNGSAEGCIQTIQKCLSDYMFLVLFIFRNVLLCMNVWHEIDQHLTFTKI